MYDTIASSLLAVIFPLHLRLIETSLNRFGVSTYGYSFTCHFLLCATIVLHRRSSTWWNLFLWAHMLGSAAILSRTEPNLPIRTWIKVPMFTSAASLVACYMLQPNSPETMSSSFPTLYLGLHMVRMGFGLVRAMIFPARYIAMCYHLEAERTQMVRKGWVNVKIVTAHGSRLDGFTFRNPAAQTKGKWLVWFGGNGEIAEGSQDSAHRYAHQLGINALVFNYRGIGDSQGRAASADDLLIDGASVLRYLHQIEKVEYKDMVLFGHSLGGGVATHLATSIDQAKGIPFVINDRSFSSLFEAVCVIGKNIAPLPRPAFQVLLNTVFGDLTTRDLWDRIPEDRKVIIYHKRDQVLPYVACSLHAALERDRVKMINVVELMETHHNLDPHNSATLQFNGHNDLIDILRRSI